MPKVLSTIKGSPCSRAMAATFSTSTMLMPGLPMDSMKRALVRALMAAAKLAGSSGSTKRVVTP